MKIPSRANGGSVLTDNTDQRYTRTEAGRRRSDSRQESRRPHVRPRSMWLRMHIGVCDSRGVGRDVELYQDRHIYITRISASCNHLLGLLKKDNVSELSLWRPPPILQYSCK